MMIAHPVGDIFFLLGTVEVLPVIITEVTIFQGELFHIPRQQSHFVAIGFQIADSDFFSIPDQQRNAKKSIRHFPIASFQFCLVKINDQVIPFNEN